MSSGEDTLTIEELQSALTATLFAYTDASNLHVVAPVSPSTDSVKNARLAALLPRFGIVACVLVGCKNVYCLSLHASEAVFMLHPV